MRIISRRCGEPLGLVSLAILLLSGVLLGGGCTFDSSLRGVSCSEDGQRSDGRVCEDGHWIKEADDDADLDAQPPQDIADAVVDDAADSPDVAPDANACGPSCDTFGVHTVVSCEQESCQRSCEPGWLDVDEDWTQADDSEAMASNGCEVECATIPEACDGADNNCDGAVDEGCECDGRDTMDCYTGPSNTADQGQCQPGTMTCEDGVWGMCQGDVTPADEDCSTGADEDCDGEPGCGDDDCDGQSCGSDNAICAGGVCCQPQSTASFCSDNNAGCGLVTATDNCGVQRVDVSCGTCLTGASCVANSCQEDDCADGGDNDEDLDVDCDDPDCLGEQCTGGICADDGSGPICCSVGIDEFCAGRCGAVTDTDRCGQQRTMSCGGCGTGASCSSNTCQETACDNGLDDDGDGDFDCDDSDCPNSGTSVVYYRDSDGDAFGVAGDTQRRCDGGNNNYTATQPGDCDDNDSDVYPGAPEECDDDAIDFDCDGNLPTAPQSAAQAFCGNDVCALDPSDSSVTCCVNPSGNCR